MNEERTYGTVAIAPVLSKRENLNMYDFDEVCGEIRDVIEKAIKENARSAKSSIRAVMPPDTAPEDVRISFTDVGLGVVIKDRLYGIAIDRID